MLYACRENTACIILTLRGVFFLHSVDDEDRFAGGRHTYKTNVAIKHDGKSSWLNPAIFKSICKVDVTYFPFDDQECFLKFGSWSFDSSKVDLAAHSGDMFNKNYVKNGEWKLTILKSQRNQIKYQCCPHAFVDVTVQIRLQRESLDFILKLIIPCSLISSMIFLGFVLPPESGERIGLSITVLLAMTVFQQLSSELMPSYGFPLLGQYYFACMVEIGASLVVTTLILNFYHRNSRRMPKALRILILHWLARVVFPQKSSKGSWNIDAPNSMYRENSKHSVDQGSDSENISLYCGDSLFDNHEPKISSTYSDPWIPLQRPRYDFGLPANGVSRYNNINGQSGHMESEKRSKYTGFAERKNSFSNHKGKARRKSSRHYGCPRHHNIPSKQNSSAISTSVILDHLPTEETEMSQAKLQNQKEWIKAARVLDRLFLILSALIGITTLLALFLKAPRFH